MLATYRHARASNTKLTVTQKCRILINRQSQPSGTTGRITTKKSPLPTYRVITASREITRVFHDANTESCISVLRMKSLPWHPHVISATAIRGRGPGLFGNARIYLYVTCYTSCTSIMNSHVSSGDACLAKIKRRY